MAFNWKQILKVTWHLIFAFSLVISLRTIVFGSILGFMNSAMLLSKDRPELVPRIMLIVFYSTIALIITFVGIFVKYIQYSKKKKRGEE